MKSILLSIKPQWVAKILNGEKTIEVRKKFPKDYKGWVYIYCTKDMNELLFLNNIYDEVKPHYDLSYKEPQHNVEFDDNNDIYEDVITDKAYLNGKVVARFYCDNVEEITQVWHISSLTNEKVISCYRGLKNGITNRQLEENSCLTHKELKNYIGWDKGYAIHISQLEIFDRPKELREFDKHNFKGIRLDLGVGEEWDKYRGVLTKAPQNFCYVEVENE